MTELSIIVPTFNERGNVEELARRLTVVLSHVAWEVIFVDDNSPDGTAETVRQLAQKDPHVRCLQRVGRRGLSSACIEGMLATSSPYLAVMDADLQHDEALLSSMLVELRNGAVDIVVGSRYTAGGSLGNWSSSRAFISRAAGRLSQAIIGAELRDPMSGFFMVRREIFHQSLPRLSAIGFKILVDVFASSPQPLRFIELPFHFRMRHAGESKLDSHVALDYLLLLLDKLIGHVIPVRFIAFSAVGAAGVILHMALLGVLFKGFQLPFGPSQAIATIITMTFNFFLNNTLTYRDRRLRSWRLLWGWLSFNAACGIGALANVGIASYLFFSTAQSWVVSALAGIIVGAVWNYSVTAIYTWNPPRQA